MKFKISIVKAIEAAEKNLQAHIVELNEAGEGWTEQVSKALDDLSKAIITQKSVVDRQGMKASNEVLRQVYAELQKLFHIKPIDNRVNYSRCIGALKLASENEDIIEMEEHEYDQLFNDNWEWRVSSKATNSTYSKGF
jgi:hypothetical protein